MDLRSSIGVAALVSACSFAGCGLSAVGHDDVVEASDAAPNDSGRAPSPTGDDAGPGAPDDAGADAAKDAAPPTPEVGPLVTSTDSLQVDCAKPTDGPIGTDGQNDGVFEVELTGPVSALALIRTDATGTTNAPPEQWDTWVGPDVVPAAMGTVFSLGQGTFQLGVYENGVLANDPDGRLSLGAGKHSLRLCASSVGSFAAGNHFRLVAQAPDGEIVLGPVLAY